uniref:Uncharacterized protein n=1 Tax=Arundo donax TaxID=35708 RepID=A0A0A8YV71_ARUDO
MLRKMCANLYLMGMIDLTFSTWVRLYYGCGG